MKGMMLLLITPQKVKIKWHNRYKIHYENKGYKFTKVGNYFAVNVEDIQHGSEVLVLYNCDYCGNTHKKPYKVLISQRKHKDDKDCCSNTKCMSERKSENRIKYGLPEGESLAEKYPNLLKEWDYQTNKISPFHYKPFSRKKVWWIGSSCGHKWEASIDKRSKWGRGCHFCAGRSVDNTNCLTTVRPDLAKEWDFDKNKGILPDEVTFCSGKSVWWKCDFGHQWKSKISNRANGSNCPVCNSSKGEEKVRRWLEKEGIKYVKEFSFDGLNGVNGGELRFDFATFDTNGKLICLIEFDGIFHFRKIYVNDRHETLVKHDRKKDKYCTEQNIKLVRIPYTEYDNLETILTKELSEGGLG
jgi:hypothetical protein